MQKEAHASNKLKTNTLMPMLMISALFFIFGFVTWLNSTLIPYFKISCQLSTFQAMFVTFAFYISYTIIALPSSWLLNRTGFHKGMTIGLWVMAAGTLMFVPAAFGRTYWLFLTGLFVMGAGLALLQTAANPYVAIIGPSESAARRMSIMGICNKFAGVIAPLILAYFILQNGDALEQSLGQMDELSKINALNALSHKVIGPYLVMTAVLLLLGLFVKLAPFPEVNVEESDGSDDSQEVTSKPRKNVLQYPQLVLGAIALFFYVGVEVIAADTIIQYGKMQGIPLSTAKMFASFTLGAMIVGYILGIVLTPKYLSQQHALKISAVLGLILSCGVVLTSGPASIACLAALGLANAIMWPAIWPLAIHGLGRFIKVGSAILIMAIAGGAIIPLIWGKLCDITSTQIAYTILLPLYLAIFMYSTWGYKVRNWKRQK